MDRLCYGWKNMTEKFGSIIIALLVLITAFSITYAVIEHKHSKDLQITSEIFIRQGAVETQDYKNKLFRNEVELNRLKVILKFVRDRSDDVVKAAVDEIDLDAPSPYPFIDADDGIIR